ncbi:methyl-accepting chemotaxis protein [Lyngbya aestuarii]|uniref:methyl-accepting chemotaxis protein n=1 Tax=Lyngbya aestuarii TaxID=118322 RepID=UPI00403E1992
MTNYQSDDSKLDKLKKNSYDQTNWLNYNQTDSYLQNNSWKPNKEKKKSESPAISSKLRGKSKILQGFYDLPIGRKQLVSLFTSEVISVLGLVGIGAWLIISGGRTQLLNQAKSELVIEEVNYNKTIDHMQFGFRGQSDNAAIIDAAKIDVQGETLSPEIKKRVKQILQNETKARNIEYATLVGKDLEIIVNANSDRAGELFNPNNLVTQALTNQTQIKASEIISKAEFAKEFPSSELTSQDNLIRYVVTPVKDPETKAIIGALVAGDIVNGKLSIVQQTIDAFGGGYSAVYLRKPSGEFALATALNQGEASNLDQTQSNLKLPDNSLLEAAVAAQGEPVTSRMVLGEQIYTMAAKSLTNAAGMPIAVLLRGTPETALNALLNNSLLLQLIVSALAVTVNVFLIIFLGRAIVLPLRQLQQTAQEFSQGNRQVRAEIFANDECGQLAHTFNEMADNIESSITEINQTERLLRQETEQLKITRQAAEELAQEQSHLNERLQQRVLELLREIDPISRGDLTIRARVTADEIGTIADAYNTTVSSLRKIVIQVQTVAQRVVVNTSNSQASVQALSAEALRSSEAVMAALDRNQLMADSVQEVAVNAKQTKEAVKQATQTVIEGEAAMNRTVDGILEIRETVTGAREKVKRLGESSEKISTVTNLISNIAAQTNLLAFNASLEAARAGEEGRGFAVVADQVRSLAQEAATATDEIEQLVAEIQKETKEVVIAMETGSEQVVRGTQLVDETRQSLNKITAASTQINQLVELITKATIVQSVASDAVSKTITDVAEIASQTSQAAGVVSSSFEELQMVAQTLQENVGQFKAS